MNETLRPQDRGAQSLKNSAPSTVPSVVATRKGLPRFWRWFFRGTEGKPGWLKYRNRWLIVHVAVGAMMALVLPGSLADAAKSVLLPLVGIFVGMSFAWVGNAQAIIQTAEIDRLAKEQGGGIENYVFTFQSA